MRNLHSRFATYELYTYTVSFSSEDNAFISECLELPGLKAHGDSQAEAINECKVAASAALEILKDHREAPPIPFDEQRFSGRLALRMSPEEHRALAVESARERVSLNHLILTRSLRRI
jgi:predicted HicB family RNase H-like nuclease